jgi:uncharacterized protein YndB with AHSA1/START domain
MIHPITLRPAPPDKVWEGIVSPESNRIIFTGADGKRSTYVHGEVLQSEPPRLLQYTFALGSSSKISRVTIELVPETEATRVSVMHDQWAEDDSAYASCADGWPRILSRLKTLIETGKTFKPH